MGTLRVMDGTGDTKHIWDHEKKEEVDAAREMFDKLTKKGYNAYAVTKKGEKGELVKEFQPLAEKIIMAPPVAAG